MEPPAPADTLRSAPKSFREDQTFLTQVKGKKEADFAGIPNGENINALYGQLNGCISDLDQKVGNVLRKHEADFLNVYRGHMFNVQKEMRLLKEKASEEENKRRRDEELVKMEQERDWFRNEAVRLDKICKEYKKSVEKWKNKADALEEDRKFLEEQVLAAKTLNLRSKKQLELYHQTYGMLQGDDFGGDSRSLSLDRPRLPLSEQLGSEASSAHHVKKVSYTGGNSPEFLSQLGEQPRAIGEMEIRYVETINHLKSQLESERRLLRQIRSAKTNYITEKGELEDFFLQCVEEVRKDILARRMKSAQLLSRSASNKTMSRATSARQFPKAAVPEGLDDIKTDMFTDGDKRRVIELLVSNEQVLLFLHESLFPKRKDQSSASVSRLQEVQSAASINPTNRSVKVPSTSHGLRSHVFSVPNFNDSKLVGRPATAPIKPKAI